MYELYEWKDDELLYLAIHNFNGLDVEKENRVDLFYLTNQNNMSRVEDIMGVLRSSLCASLWIGEASDYQDFRWNDYTYLINLVNSGQKYVFYGLSLYLLIGDVVLGVIRDKGLKLSRLKTHGVGYKGKVAERNWLRFLLTNIDVEWMNSFLFVVDCRLIDEDHAVLYYDRYCNCQTYGVRRMYNMTMMQHNPLIMGLSEWREEDFERYGDDRISGHYLLMNAFTYLASVCSSRSGLRCFYDINRWLKIWMSNIVVYDPDFEKYDLRAFSDQNRLFCSNLVFIAAYIKQRQYPESREHVVVWHKPENILVPRG